jgi:hypothetical protein
MKRASAPANGPSAPGAALAFREVDDKEEHEEEEEGGELALGGRGKKNALLAEAGKTQ